MDIRPLTEDDAGQFRHLRLQALESEPTAFGEAAEEHRARSIEYIRERLRADPNESVVIGAFEENRLKGTVGFRRDQSSKRRHRGVIWGMFVAPEIRGRGVGYDLLTNILRLISGMPGVTCTYLSVAHTHPAARRLYLRCGFTPYGVDPRGLLVNGEYVREEHMFLRTGEPCDQ